MTGALGNEGVPVVWLLLESMTPMVEGSNANVTGYYSCGAKSQATGSPSETRERLVLAGPTQERCRIRR